MTRLEDVHQLFAQLIILYDQGVPFTNTERRLMQEAYLDLDRIIKALR